MFNQVWDAKAIGESFPNAVDLNQIIKSVENEHASSNLVICRVIVNGLSFDEYDEKKYEAVPVNSLNELQIEMHDIRDLLTDTDQTNAKYALGIVEQALSTADLFRGKDVHRAHGEFKSLITNFDSLLAANNLVLDVGRAQQIEFAPERVEIEMKFQALLHEVLMAYEKHDLILVADLLEYELTERVNALMSLINGRLNKVETPAKGEAEEK